MNNSLVIARNELRLFFKNRAAYVWIFIVPLLFVALFSFIPTGPGKSSNRFPPVLVENADTGFLGKIYDDVLGAQGLWRLDPAKDKRNKPVANIRIPADFTARLLAKQPANVELTILPAGGSASGDAGLIEVRVLRSLIVMNSRLLEAAGAGTEGVARASLPAISSSAAPEAGAAAGRAARPLRPSTSTFNFNSPARLAAERGGFPRRDRETRLGRARRQVCRPPAHPDGHRLLAAGQPHVLPDDEPAHLRRLHRRRHPA